MLKNVDLVAESSTAICQKIGRNLQYFPQSSFQWIQILMICFEVDDLQGLVTDSLSLTLLSWLISHILKPCTPSCFSAPKGLIIYAFVWYVGGTNSRLQIVWIQYRIRWFNWGIWILITNKMLSQTDFKKVKPRNRSSLCVLMLQHLVWSPTGDTGPGWPPSAAQCADRRYEQGRKKAVLRRTTMSMKICLFSRSASCVIYLTRAGQTASPRRFLGKSQTTTNVIQEPREGSVSNYKLWRGNFFVLVQLKLTSCTLFFLCMLSRS